MAKTVFGIPGVGDKPEGGGGAVAPGGTGAQTGGDLPQKPSKEEGDAPQESKPSKPSLNLSGSLGTAPKAPSMAKPKGPAMAKPQGPAMAKPVTGPPKPKPGGKVGAKTVFGMPAMKLPGAPGGTPPQGIPAQTTPPQPQQPAAPPASNPPQPAAPASDAAFGATVLGMVPATNEPPATGDQPPGAIEEATAAPDENEEEAGAAQDSADVMPAETPAETPEASTSEPVPVSQVEGPVEDESISQTKKTPRLMLIGIGIIIIVLLVIVGWLIFGCSPTVETPKNTNITEALPTGSPGGPTSHSPPR